MSLETEIQSLTAAVENLAFIIKQMNVTQKATPITPPPPVVVESVVVAPSPVAPVAPPVSVTVATPVVAMPPMPTFITPAPAPQVTHGKAPFTDSKGLMTYVMASYQSLGAEKGALIQTVLANLKYQNINDIKPEDYDALFAGVEALK